MTEQPELLVQLLAERYDPTALTEADLDATAEAAGPGRPDGLTPELYERRQRLLLDALTRRRRGGRDAA